MIKEGTFTLSSTVNTDDRSGPWTIEWSEKQQAFHIEPLSLAMDRNRRAFMSASNNDYQALLVCSSHAEAHEFCEYFRNIRNEKGKRIPTLEEKIERNYR